MKNDLTAEEWLVLNDNLQLGIMDAMDKWSNQGKLERNMELLNSAEEKIKKVATKIIRTGVKIYD